MGREGRGNQHAAEKRPKRTPTTDSVVFGFSLHPLLKTNSLVLLTHLRAAVPDVHERHRERALRVHRGQPALEDAVGQSHRDPLVQHL